MSKIKDNSFIPGDFVVYPSHGVGKIIGTETREIENKIINECRKTIACESNIANSIICGKDIANIIEEYGTF